MNRLHNLNPHGIKISKKMSNPFGEKTSRQKNKIPIPKPPLALAPTHYPIRSMTFSFHLSPASKKHIPQRLQLRKNYSWNFENRHKIRR